ncbi:MAG: hypothetical protein LBP59_18620 [Planctomycetaceae bacterium]|nr:hypothetical protein [Planctomycetaceae bacterium]
MNSRYCAFVISVTFHPDGYPAYYRTLILIFPKNGKARQRNLIKQNNGLQFYTQIVNEFQRLYRSYLNFIDLKASKPAVRKLGRRR